MRIIDYLNRDPDRPVQVTLAVYLLYACLAIGALFSLVRTLLTMWIFPEHFLWDYLPSILFIAVLVYLSIFVVSKNIASGENWARWVLLLGLIPLLIISFGIAPHLLRDDVNTIILFQALSIMVTIATFLVFHPDVGSWFTTTKSGREQGKIKGNRVETGIAGWSEKEAAQNYMRFDINAEKKTRLASEAPLRVKIWLVFSMIISALLLIPWLGLLVFASMIGWPYLLQEEGITISSIMFSLMIFYPFFVIAGVIATAALYVRGQHIGAAIAAIAPVATALLIASFWLFFG